MNKLSINIHSRFGSQYWQYRVRLKDGTIIRKSTGIKKSDDPNKFQAKFWVKNLYKDRIFDRKFYYQLKALGRVIGDKINPSRFKKDVKKQFGYNI